MRTIEKAAPCRVDLAGGTVDLWPLYLHMGKLQLVHMGLDLRATAIATHDKDRAFSVEISSDDYQQKKTFASMEELRASLKQSTKTNPLRWLCRMAEFFLLRSGKEGSLVLKTMSQVPPGSGLGGSSTLGIAMAQALAELFYDPLAKDAWGLQQTVRDLEAAEIEHPAGDQDYVPALFGGLLIFKLSPGSRTTERIPDEIARTLASKLALVYTGKPHHSGLNNWQIFKAYHDGNPKVRRALQKIHDISAQMAEALREGRLEELPKLINDEWKQRQLLGKGVNAPELEKAWSFAKKQGAVARKACGAGGGGCLLVYFPDDDKRKLFLRSEAKQGWKIFPVTPAFKGVAI